MKVEPFPRELNLGKGLDRHGGIQSLPLVAPNHSRLPIRRARPARSG